MAPRRHERARRERSRGQRDLLRGDAFERNDEGELVAGVAQECQSAGAAESAARRIAEIAFLRTGNPAKGEFEDAVVLRVFGKVPNGEELLAA